MALQNQDWAGLHALWRGVKRVGTVLAMTFVGGVCGAGVGVLLFPCLFYLAVPFGVCVGVGFGTWLGFRIAPRDAALVFVLAPLMGALTYWIALRNTDSTLVPTIAGVEAYFLTVLIALRIGRHLPVPVRYRAAVVATWGFGFFAAFWIVRGLWFSG